jgi:hypothetical protein
VLTEEQLKQQREITSSTESSRIDEMVSSTGDLQAKA